MSAPPASPPPATPATSAGHRLRARLAAVRRVAHAVLGAPDYDRYVAHLQACHPEAPLPDRAAFERERLAARYSRPGARCC